MAVCVALDSFMDWGWQAFAKMSLAISVAARHESDPDKNPALALAIRRARAINMPKSNIENAVSKFSQKGSGDAWEEVLYEGSGPAGSAVIIEVLTDNRKRIAPQLRSIFSKHEGNLGTSGSVGWLFERTGVVVCHGATAVLESAMEAAIDAGASEVEELETHEEQEKGGILVYCPPSSLPAVREAVERNHPEPEDGVEASLEYVASSTVALEDEAARETFSRMLEAFEDNDDVQQVYHNVEGLGASVEPT